MDILILSIGFRPNIGGLETHLTDLTGQLVKKIKVMVVTLSPITTKVKAKVVERSKNLVIWRVPWYGGGLFYKLQKYYFLEFIYLIPPLFAGLLWALIRYPGIKVIHAQGLSGAIAALLLGKVFRKRLVVSTHFVFHFKNDFFGMFSRFIFSNFDRVLCVSLASRGEMAKLGVPKEKLGKCAYWVNLDMFKPMNKLKAKKAVEWPDDFSVMFIGRLVAEKGVRELLEAVPDISKDIQVYIVGDGPLRERVQKVADKSSNLHYLGRIDNAMTPVYYSAADLVVVPSYEETLGKVSMEAFGCGTPVVASSAGGIKEVVNDSVGILIDVKASQISSAINKLYEDQKLYERLQKNTRAHVQKYYSSKNAEVFLKEYGY